MTTLTNAAFFRAKPGRSEDLGARLLALVEPTRAEPGCLRYDIFQSVSDPNEWFIHEDWHDRRAFEMHMATPHVAAFMPLIAELCERDVEIRAFQPRTLAA